MPGPKINWETVAISLGAAIIVAGGTLGATAITGHQQSQDLDKNLTAQGRLQDKNLKAQAQSSDKAGLREVIDEAEVAIVRTEAADTKALAAIERHIIGPPDRFEPPDFEPTKDREVIAFLDRVDTLDRPQARLTTRLGDQSIVTRAFAVVQLAFEAGAGCRTIFNNTAVRAADQSTTQRAIKYFNAAANDLIGSNVARSGSNANKTQPVDPPTLAELEKLRHDVNGQRCR
jgi:hypothetical protein